MIREIDTQTRNHPGASSVMDVGGAVLLAWVAEERSRLSGQESSGMEERALADHSRIAKEGKVEDKRYRDSTGVLANLYTEKNQAEADLKVALNTPVVNPAHDSLVAEVNDLKATMVAMTQDIEKLEKEKEKKPRAKVGEKTEAGQAQGFLDELV